MEVTHDDRHLCTCDDEDDEDEKEEAKDVVKLVEPYRGEDEEELDENGAKRHDTSEDAGDRRVQVPWLWWNEAWDGLGPDREGDRLLFEACEGPEEDERAINDTPEEEELKELKEGHGYGGAFMPHKEIDENKRPEGQRWVENSDENGVLFPLIPPEGFIIP